MNFEDDMRRLFAEMDMTREILQALTVELQQLAERLRGITEGITEPEDRG